MSLYPQPTGEGEIVLKDWWEALVDLVYPPRCPGCSGDVDSHGMLCPVCLADVLCQREINVVDRRLKWLDSCLIVCEYRGAVRKLIHEIKFRRVSRFASHLSRLLTERFEADRIVGIDVVVPVPLHSVRLAERGYNQTELIFHSWAEGRGWFWLETLERVRPTTPQWELDLAARRKNIKGAFVVTRPELVHGKTILLVDDILTSGITLNECAKMLKKSGAKKVFGLALASRADR